MLGYRSVIDNDGVVYGGSNGVSWWWSAPAEGASQKSFIYNSGSIEGENAGIYMDTSETVVIKNSGVISGGSYAISITGAGPVRIVNHGLLDGLVALGGGNDVYNGVDGEANGNVQGYGGNDRLFGGDSEDILFGDGGNDTLSGGGNNDFLGGGEGRDKLTGGAGADQFLYFSVSESSSKSTADLITDFSHVRTILSASAVSTPGVRPKRTTRSSSSARPPSPAKRESCATRSSVTSPMSRAISTPTRTRNSFWL